ncbi:MAG: hypothetical protein GYB66_16700 [Chloroflexi bacterium]|nr:hypothetical protein [Chloroflexota bacterium]
MIVTQHPDHPHGFEAEQDPTLDRDGQRPVSEMTDAEARHHDYRQGDPKKGRKQDRATGIHPTIRATSTDDDGLRVPAPLHDDPIDDVPGERENPQRDVSEDDIVEDAVDDS